MAEDFKDIFDGYENNPAIAYALIEWQKQEIESLTGNMNAFGLAAKRLAEEKEALEKVVERLEGDLIIERTRRENAVNSYHLSKADGAREAIEDAISTLEEKCLLLVTSNGKYCFEKEAVMFWLRSVAYKLKKKYTEGKDE